MSTVKTPITYHNSVGQERSDHLGTTLPLSTMKGFSAEIGTNNDFRKEIKGSLKMKIDEGMMIMTMMTK